MRARLGIVNPLARLVGAWTPWRRGLLLVLFGLLATSPLAASAGVGEAWVRLEAGREARRSGDTERALREFRAALEVAPGWFFPHLEIAEIAVEQREGEAAALEALQRFASDGERNPRYHRLLGVLLERSGDDVGCAAAWARSLALDGGQHEVRAQRAAVLGRLGRHEEAVEEYRHVLAKTPYDLIVRARLADALEQADRYEEARAELERLVSLQPQNPLPLRRLARFLERRGELAAAKAAHARADRLAGAPPQRKLRPLPASRR